MLIINKHEASSSLCYNDLKIFTGPIYKICNRLLVLQLELSYSKKYRGPTHLQQKPTFKTTI